MLSLFFNLQAHPMKKEKRKSRSSFGRDSRFKWSNLLEELTNFLKISGLAMIQIR